MENLGICRPRYRKANASSGMLSTPIKQTGKIFNLGQGIIWITFPVVIQEQRDCRETGYIIGYLTCNHSCQGWEMIPASYFAESAIYCGASGGRTLTVSQSVFFKSRSLSLFFRTPYMAFQSNFQPFFLFIQCVRR